MSAQPLSISSPASDPSPLELLRPTILRWRTDPTAFVREALKADPEPWQIEALRAVATKDRIAIRSGHGVGKSALLSWVLLWFLLTRYPAKVACTAPTSHQLEDVLWGEVALWHRRLAEPFRSWLQVKHLRAELTGAPNEAFAVARTARQEQPEALQGFHSDNMLFLIDEASGVADAIFEVAAGAMSTHGAKTIMTGNPTRPYGYFHAAFHRARAIWHTMRVACTDSSRVGPAYPEEMAALYGRDSNAFKVRVLGEFPTAADDAIIGVDLIEAAYNRQVEPIAGRGTVWGLDVARFGDDMNALAIRRGNVMPAPVQVWAGMDTMQTAGRVMRLYEDTPRDDLPVQIAVDVIGIGAGVVDRLVELGLPAVGINVAENAALQARYWRQRDELWFGVREWLMARNCRMARDEELARDLVAPTYSIRSEGQVVVERKEETKKRLGRSPDRADAFCLTFALGETRAKKDLAWKRAMRQATAGSRSWMTG
jgi:phage terminase large subunit